MQVLSSVLWFVVAIGILVTVHEFGHFWVARRLGVKVLRFSVGFGQPLWRMQRGADQTEYVVAAIPLGGYVKMLDEREGEVPEAERHRAFNRQSIGVRIAVVVAGPLFNFLFAILAYWLMFVLGIGGLKPLVAEVEPASLAARAGLDSGDEILAVGERTVKTWQGVIEGVIQGTLDKEVMSVSARNESGENRELQLDLSGLAVDDLTQGQFFGALGFKPARPLVPPVIHQVEADKPAAASGFEAGDRIVAVAGVPVSTRRAFIERIKENPEKTLRVEVERTGQRLSLEVRPSKIESEEGTIGRIGVMMRQPERAEVESYYAVERYGVVRALGKGFDKMWEMSALTVRLLWRMVTLEVSVRNLSGPISIAQYASLSAEVGLSRFLDFLGLVSISLGIINLLPIPLLDGGHLLYYLIEFVRGRPLSEQAQYAGQRLGIAMLVGLMSVAFYNDLARLFS